MTEFIYLLLSNCFEGELQRNYFSPILIFSITLSLLGVKIVKNSLDSINVFSLIQAAIQFDLNRRSKGAKTLR